MLAGCWVGLLAVHRAISCVLSGKCVVFAYPNVACADPVYSASRPVVIVLLALSVCVPMGFFAVVWKQLDVLLRNAKQRLSTGD